MVSGISIWPAEKFANQFRARCVGEDGRRLSALIEQNALSMVQAAELGRPAAAPLLALIPEDLAERLRKDDPLMQTFGYLVALEMSTFGYRWKRRDSVKTNWPFSDKVSALGMIRRETSMSDIE